MAYNKTSEERKWNYWKEQEEKKLRELGMEEEKIQKLRQMDREDFLEERRYREHLDETMQDMDSIKEKDSELFARDVKELLDHIGDKRIYELLKETEHQTLEILLLSTWGYSGREVAKIMGMGPHHHAAVPCDLQGQGLPAGADEFIRFHAVTVAHPAEKRKRGGRDRIRIKRLKEEC